MKKIIKVGVKIPKELKGCNLCDTIFKNNAEVIAVSGEQKGFISIQDITGHFIGVSVVNYKTCDYLIAKRDGKLLACIPM